MSVSFISFSHSSERSSDTSFFSGSPSLCAWKSLGQGETEVCSGLGRAHSHPTASPPPLHHALSRVDAHGGGGGGFDGR